MTDEGEAQPAWASPSASDNSHDESPPSSPSFAPVGRPMVRKRFRNKLPDPLPLDLGRVNRLGSLRSSYSVRNAPADDAPCRAELGVGSPGLTAD